jgi:hypothetical protein
MTDILKLETVGKVSYVLFENYSRFGAEVTVDEMKDMLKQIETALNNIPDLDEDFIAEKTKIKTNINKKLIPSIKAFYNAEMEEIK